MKILISFIICTYNSPELIKKCADSIISQKYKGNFEIIFADGGSDSKTIKLLNDYKKKLKCVRILINKEKLPEGLGKGKWLAWKNARGEFIAIVDQDNELIGENCIMEMLKPFYTEDIFGCACKVILRKKDSLTNRYIALMGTDPVLAYRSLDGIINLKKNQIEKKDYFIFKINKESIILTGGNCFIYKKSCLDDVGGYVQDTENIMKLVKFGHNKMAVSKKAYTHHFATKGFFDFLAKKKKWAITYSKKRNSEFSYTPKTKNERKALILNLFFIFVIIPNIFIATKKYIETRELSWYLHPILAFLTSIIYILFSFVKISE